MPKDTPCLSSQTEHIEHITQMNESAITKNDYITTREASEILGFSRGTINNYIHKGILTGYRINRNRGRWRLCRNEVERIAREGLPQPEQENGPEDPDVLRLQTWVTEYAA